MMYYDPGTLVGDAGVRCVVPQADPLSALPLTLPVRLTLNGQQFTVGPADFTYYGFRLAGGLGYVVPNTVAISPVIGPVAGGTAVAVYGAALSRGSDYSCRFGAAGESVPWLGFARTLPLTLTLNPNLTLTLTLTR